jgi:arylsulfatase A-like enzyme
MKQPNILFILVDDMGWRDLACYGSTFYETPNIDRLFAEGMHFTDAYAACPVCSPTRASIMTGRYPSRLKLTNYIDWKRSTHPLRGRIIDAPYIDQLPSNELTLAGALREQGYATWHVGKWHLGPPWSYPENRGFDINIGGCECGMPTHGYFAPWKLPNLSGEDVPEGTYLDDYLTDRAIDLVKSSGEKPFFLNMWFYLVHTPLQGKDADVAHFEAKSRALGMDDQDPFVEGDRFPYQSPSRDGKRVRHRVIQSNTDFAAMVKALDDNVGRLLAALAETGQEKDTIVVLTSDNGGLSTGPAATCNSPLKHGKGWMEEGGTREPLIIRWPGVVKEGAVCREPVTSPDFFPTLLEACGAPAMPERHVDGKSFLNALKGNPFHRGPVFWHYPHFSNCGGHPGCSVRSGDFILIRFFEDGHRELYNLRTDIAQGHDLATEMPGTADELDALLDDWLAETGALLPTPNPEWEEQYPDGCSPAI